MSEKDLRNMLGAIDDGQNENADAKLALLKQLNKLLGETAEQADKAVSAKPQPKVVRDSFTMPENDYNLMHELQDRALGLRIRTTKGEVLRAGLHALSRLSDDEFIQVFSGVEKLKPGRRKE